MFKGLRSVFRVLTRRRDFEDGMSEELRFHIEEYTKDLVRSGMSREKAARQIRMELGSLTNIKRDCREAFGVHLFDGELGSHHLVTGRRGVDAGERIDHAHPDRGLAARLDDEGRRHLEDAERGGAFHQRTTIEFWIEIMRYHQILPAALLIFFVGVLVAW